MRRLFVSLVCVAGLALPALAGSGAVTIADSGSTNRAGFRIVVERSGKAEMTVIPRRSGAAEQTVEGKIAAAETERLFADVEAARPLSGLPKTHCMKSVSFGSTRTIEFEGARSPDLSCGDGGNAALRDLIRDVREIVAQFGPLSGQRARRARSAERAHSAERTWDSFMPK
jgi:hypothetical protein